MLKNDTKKHLYKVYTEAHFICILKGVAYYEAALVKDHNVTVLKFQVPVDEMGDVKFEADMDLRYLIRYLV
jgi:hypothetical protein